MLSTEGSEVMLYTEGVGWDVVYRGDGVMLSTEGVW